MMTSFIDACKSVGYNPNAKISQEIVYFAYKDGETKKFDSKIDALEFSKLIEKKVINQEEIDNFRKNQRKKESIAVEYFRDHLYMEEYHMLSKAQFNVLWDEAFQRQHEYGYDAIADEIYDLYVCIKKFNNA